MRLIRTALLCLAPTLAPALAEACDGLLLDDPAIYGGPLCLDDAPERVVVLDPSFGLGIALDAGLPLVGAPLDLMSNAALKARAEATGVTSIGVMTEPSLETRLADLRARMPDTSVSVLRITSWDFQVYLDAPVTYAPFALMQEAGVTRSAYETTRDETLSMKRPDWEDLAQLDGEVLLYIVGGTNDSDRDGRHEEVLGNPLWQTLPAVQAGNVHRVDHADWMEFSGLDSANAVLDDLEAYVIDE